MLKKLFGGKANTKTKGGSTVYTYEDKESGVDFSVAESLYAAEVDEHFGKQFPGREVNVFHEIVSDKVHIDINIMEPTEKEPYRVLYTTGMSDLPMTLPAEMEEKYSHLKRAELMMFLPASWPVGDEAFKDESNYWPIRLLKQLARFPHQYNTYLGYGHTLPNSAQYTPYADNTELSGVILSLLGDDICSIETKDNNLVVVYSLIPLYKEEMEYKLENGADALFNKLSKVRGAGYTLDVSRKNVVKR